jgi:hypothetical protein
MRRRTFIEGTAALAAAWPLAARAQQPERIRRIGVLMNREPGSPDGQARITAFQQALQQLGWSDGRNVRIDIRWGGTDVERERRYAAELIALAPDIILAGGTAGAKSGHCTARLVSHRNRIRRQTRSCAELPALCRLSHRTVEQIRDYRPGTTLSENDVNEVMEQLRAGKIIGRVVLTP